MKILQVYGFIAQENSTMGADASEIVDIGLSSLNFLIIIIILSLASAWLIWWTFTVFKTFPDFLSDIANRVDETYGKIGVFIFILLLAPAFLGFIIKLIVANINTFSESLSHWLSFIK